MVRRGASKKMFCVGAGDLFRYALACTKKEAESILGVGAHRPSSDELRRIWVDNRLHERTPATIKSELGISRQALWAWRQRVATDLPKHREFASIQRQQRIAQHIDQSKSITLLASEIGVSPNLIRKFAGENNISIVNRARKKPDDVTIIQLAKGRTWKQLADACGITLGTLRNYVYQRPQLSQEIRKYITYETSGAPAHGKLDIDRMTDMHAKGISAYAISLELGVHQMTVAYWFKKLGLTCSPRASAHEEPSVIS